jgi:hypothetical protein
MGSQEESWEATEEEVAAEAGVPKKGTRPNTRIRASIREANLLKLVIEILLLYKIEILSVYGQGKRENAQELSIPGGAGPPDRPWIILRIAFIGTPPLHICTRRVLPDRVNGYLLHSAIPGRLLYGAEDFGSGKKIGELKGEGLLAVVQDQVSAFPVPVLHRCVAAVKHIIAAGFLGFISFVHHLCILLVFYFF